MKENNKKKKLNRILPVDMFVRKHVIGSHRHMIKFHLTNICEPSIFLLLFLLVMLLLMMLRGNNDDGLPFHNQIDFIIV